MGINLRVETSLEVDWIYGCDFNDRLREYNVKIEFERE